MPKALLFTHSLYDKGKPILYRIEKSLSKDGNIVKSMNIDLNPDYHFYKIKDEYLLTTSPRKQISADKVDRIDCKYHQLYEAIASTSKDRKLKYDKLTQLDSPSNMRKMHDDLNLCLTDLHLEDYAMAQWKRVHRDEITDEFPLTKGFFDIEVDSINHEGFPDENEAPCPINFFSYLDSNSLTLYGLCLLNPENQSQKEFYLKYRETKGNIHWTSDNNEFCRNVLNTHFNDENEDIGAKPLQRLEIVFFADELDLIKYFFKLVNEHKLDYMGAWNSYFDLKTIENRIIKLGESPETIMCAEVPYRKVQIVYDNRTDDIRDRSNTFNITSNSIWCDMTFFYAAIRKPQGMKESYSLDYTLLNEIGESKFDYDGDIKDAVYVNYEAFLLYSLYDSYRLYQLECKTKDMNTVHELSLLSSTRAHKVFKKTIMIRNFTADRQIDKGRILTNNLNVFIEHETEKFEGAFVSDPALNTNKNGITLVYYEDDDV